MAAMRSPRLPPLALMVLLAGCRQGAGHEDRPEGVTGRVIIPFQEAAYAGGFAFDGTHIYAGRTSGLKRIAVSF